MARCDGKINGKISSPGTSYLVCLSLNFISDIIEVGEFLVADLPHKFPSPALGAFPRGWCSKFKDPKNQSCTPCRKQPKLHFQRTPAIWPSPQAPLNDYIYPKKWQNGTAPKPLVHLISGVLGGILNFYWEHPLQMLSPFLSFLVIKTHPTPTWEEKKKRVLCIQVHQS